MTFALEPMLTLGNWHTKVGADGWVVSTIDRSLAAHFEHTIAITTGEAEILTTLIANSDKANTDNTSGPA